MMVIMKKKILPIIVILAFFVMQVSALQHIYSSEHVDVHPKCEYCHLAGQMHSANSVSSFSLNIQKVNIEAKPLLNIEVVVSNFVSPYFSQAPPFFS